MRDYIETNRPPELFWKAYRAARDAGLKTTTHAGEFGMKWTNVETAIELLGAIGPIHGCYRGIENPEPARRRRAGTSVHRRADQHLLFTGLTVARSLGPPERPIWAN